MSDYDEVNMGDGRLTDYAKKILDKFRATPEPNKEMLDQLKMLPDAELEMYRDAYPSNIYVGSEWKRRQGGGK